MITQIKMTENDYNFLQKQTYIIRELIIYLDYIN